MGMVARSGRLRIFALILITLGTVLLGLAILGPVLGLGEGESFITYRLGGMPRTLVIEISLTVIAAGNCALLARWGALHSEYITALRNSPPIWLTGILRHLMSPARLVADMSSVPLLGSPAGLLPPAMLIFILIAVLFVSFHWGFDVTDEGKYLYDMQHPDTVSAMFIDPIAGRSIGWMFDNNIIVWRSLTLGLFIVTACVFATGLQRMAERMGIVVVAPINRGALLIATVTGALAYFSFGAPTFCYNAAASAGVMMAYGAIMHALATKRKAGVSGWIAAASLGAVLMVAGRIPAAVVYPIAGLPLVWLGGRLVGWRAVFSAIGQHLAFCLLWGLLITFGLGLGAQFLSIGQVMFWGGTEGIYLPSSVLSRHAADMVELARHAIWLASRAIGIAALLGLAVYSGDLLVHGPRRGRGGQAVAAALILAIALMPLWIIIDYWRRWPSFLVNARLGCAHIEDFACQGPSPAEDGHIFAAVVIAQLLSLLVLAGVDRWFPTLPSASSPSGDGKMAPWLGLIAFLMLATVVPSFYTGTGLVYHLILGLGPAFAASYVGIGMIPLRRIQIPAWPGFAMLSLFGIAVFLTTGHNRVLFIHRVDGAAWEQTVRLQEPPILRGLYVSPHTAEVFGDVRDALATGGFDQTRDLMVAAYGLPGMIVAMGAKSLGTAWVTSGYPNIDRVNCMFLRRDPTDPKPLGRVFILQNMDMNPVFQSCLEERGLDFAHENALANITVDPRRSIKLLIVPISSAP